MIAMLLALLNLTAISLGSVKLEVRMKENVYYGLRTAASNRKMQHMIFTNHQLKQIHPQISMSAHISKNTVSWLKTKTQGMPARLNQQKQNAIKVRIAFTSHLIKSNFIERFAKKKET